jgi:uncharacterized repeat protein (TIGR03803 family)
VKTQNRLPVSQALLRTFLTMSLTLGTAILARAGTASVIHSFTGSPDGKIPSTAMISDSSGNLYGGTTNGGTGLCMAGCGAIFKLSPVSGGGWTESIIYSFQGGATGDGQFPIGALTSDASGNIYGVTSQGGATGNGTVFRLSPGTGGWTETVLYAFKGGTTDGGNPVGKVVFDSAGNLFGVTGGAGAHNTGTVYMLVPTSSGMWTETLLYSFPASGSALGTNPSGVIFDGAGTLWGVTTFGGTSAVNGAGVVFQLIKNTSGVWTQRVIKKFSTAAADVQTPTGGLAFDAAGDLFMTMSRGAQGGASVFELTPTTGGNYQGHVLHAFQGPQVVQPYESITFDSTGALYSAASVGGGSCDCGMVYKLTPVTGGWSSTVLLTMNGTSGNEPIGGVALDSSGNAIVATQFGGLKKDGAVLQVAP